MNPQYPITDPLPEGVPLVADFHDNRNRLSHYFPVLKQSDIRVPVTKFWEIDGDYNTRPEIDWREITGFMQHQSMRWAFVRGDFSSGKYGGDEGSVINSQDAYDIEDTVLEMFKQLAYDDRWLGRRIAVREYIPHDREIRAFVRDGETLYMDSVGDGSGYPGEQVEEAAQLFDTFAWSVDFIRHSKTGKWYCIDMGLDGLHYGANNEWTAISEHIQEEHSPEQYVDEMPPRPDLLTW
jgi:hypothetical protein